MGLPAVVRKLGFSGRGVLVADHFVVTAPAIKRMFSLQLVLTAAFLISVARSLSRSGGHWFLLGHLCQPRGWPVRRFVK